MEGLKMLEIKKENKLVIIFNEMHWYKRIKFLRVNEGWNQKQAGAKCFTYGKNFWQWENGICYPSRASKKAIAYAFGLKTEHIFSDNDKNIKN